MKITFERDANGEIISLETITEKEGILSDSERAQLQMFYDEEFKKLKEKHAHEQKRYIHDEKMKAFEENRIIQVEIAKNQAEMSMTSSNTYGKFWDALGSLAIASCCPDQSQPNQLPPNPQPTKKVN